MQIDYIKIKKIINSFYDDINYYDNVIYLNNEGNEKFIGYYFDNYPSILIFLAYYNVFTNSKKATPLIYKYTELLVNALKNKKSFSLSFAYGFTGVLLSLEMVKKTKSINIELSELESNYEAMVRSRLKKIKGKLSNNTIKESDYDFINGLTSNLFTLLCFSKDGELINKSIDYLCIYIQSLINNSALECNLGVAHGIGGIMLVLNYAYHNKHLSKDEKNKIKYNLKIVSELYISIYLRKTGNRKQKLINPWEDKVNVSKLESKIIKRKQSWCYGTPGIAYGLLKTAEIIYNKDLKILIKNIFSEINTMELKSTQLNTPTFCHGISGLLSILLNLKFYYSVDVDLLISKLVNELVNKYYENKSFGFRDYDFVSRGEKYNKAHEFLDLGLLNGATGCILTLMSLLNLKVLDWTKIFLI